MNRQRWIALSLAVLVVMAAIGLRILNSNPKSDLPPGTVYYTGPMKGKGGDTGIDQFNPYK